MMVPLWGTQLQDFQFHARLSARQRSAASPSATDKPSHMASAEKIVHAMNALRPNVGTARATGAAGSDCRVWLIPFVSSAAIS